MSGNNQKTAARTACSNTAHRSVSHQQSRAGIVLQADEKINGHNVILHSVYHLTRLPDSLELLEFDRYPETASFEEGASETGMCFAKLSTNFNTESQVSS